MSLEIYYSADVIWRREIYWKAWMVRNWEGLAHPLHICMPWALNPDGF